MRAIRPQLLALCLILSAAPVHASGKKAEGDKPAAEAAHVDLAPVAAPIVVGGMVKNYVFITVRLAPTAKADLKALRDKEPLLRDAVVRTAHHTPFTRSDSYNSVDEAKARAALLPALAAVAGQGQIKGVEITLQQPKNLVRGPAR